MILTLKELADHLKVNERTILRMLQSGQIQGAKIGGQWRFNSTQIDRMFFPEENNPDPLAVSDLLPKHLALPFSRIARQDRMVLNLESGDVESVLNSLCQPVVRDALLPDMQTLRSRLKAREDLLSTGVGHGVAIPHPRDPIPTLREPAVLVIGRNPEGIPFNAVDGNPVQLFFMVVCQTIQTHLLLMGRLADVLRKPGFIDECLAAEDEENILRAILKAERKEFFQE